MEADRDLVQPRLETLRPRPFPWFWLALLGIASAAVGYGLGLDWLKLVSMPLPVLMLALGLAGLPKDAFSRWLLTGFGLCAAADLAIQLSFLAGLVLFLLGHLCFILGFRAEVRDPALLRALPFAAWGGGAIAWLWPGLGSMAVPVALYTLTICAMMWRAAALLAPSRPWAGWILAGALVFALSDTLIAFNRFHAPVPGAGVWILGLYWTAMFCLARGVHLRAGQQPAR